MPTVFSSWGNTSQLKLVPWSVWTTLIRQTLWKKLYECLAEGQQYSYHQLFQSPSFDLHRVGFKGSAPYLLVWALVTAQAGKISEDSVSSQVLSAATGTFTMTRVETIFPPVISLQRIKSTPEIGKSGDTATSNHPLSRGHWKLILCSGASMLIIPTPRLSTLEWQEEADDNGRTLALMMDCELVESHRRVISLQSFETPFSDTNHCEIKSFKQQLG